MASTSLPTGASGRPARDVARACATEAGQIIRDGFGQVVVAATKGRGNVVTDTDFAAERAVAEILRGEFPDHAILSEETASTTRSDGWMWVVDPLDGTKNFSRGIPHFAFNIALCFDGRPLLALTSQPLLGEEFLAVAGEGCTLNGVAAHVSDRETVADSVFAMDLGYDDDRARRQIELALQLWPGMQSLRIPGSAALGFAYVAAGRYDLFLHANLFPWDVAAGILLVREAGGTITDRDGDEISIYSEGAIAATPAVHADFRALAGARPWR
jgi:fructose-1,6-bisphosphatase/inositol monophosphatase family enzyme